MNDQHKKHQTIKKYIIKKNVKAVDATKDISIIIYYRSTKVHNPLMDIK